MTDRILQRARIAFHIGKPHHYRTAKWTTFSVTFDLPDEGPPVHWDSPDFETIAQAAGRALNGSIGVLILPDAPGIGAVMFRAVADSRMTEYRLQGAVTTLIRALYAAPEDEQ